MGSARCNGWIKMQMIQKMTLSEDGVAMFWAAEQVVVVRRNHLGLAGDRVTLTRRPSVVVTTTFPRERSLPRILLFD